MESIDITPDLYEEPVFFEGERVFTDFLLEFLVADIREEEIQNTYPYFTREDLYASLTYATYSLKNDEAFLGRPILSVS